MKITVPNKENHWALWNWLSENPEETKFRWPGFETLRALKIWRGNFCFLCLEFEDCSKCPLEKKYHGACAENGIYEQYTHSFEDRRVDLARKIRDCWR